MRLLLTLILYLGLLCPASVLATPIRATPSSTEVDSTGNVTRTLHARDEKPVTEYTVELKLHHLRPKGTKPHVITEEVADNLRDGMEILLPWILPIFVADEENRRLDPKTVPDLHSSFRVSELSYEGSYTTGRESIVPRDQAKHFHMPRDGWSVGIDEYWLYLMILGSNARQIGCRGFFVRYHRIGRQSWIWPQSCQEPDHIDSTKRTAYNLRWGNDRLLRREVEVATQRISTSENNGARWRDHVLVSRRVCKECQGR
ncbi:hypothetical protein C8R42DRAFT_28104 [Lentinula raphanica]|nr:hypothetical protein C8R42DRAFT_28104 [Lentinula raphanica]